MGRAVAVCLREHVLTTGFEGKCRIRRVRDPERRDAGPTLVALSFEFNGRARRDDTAPIVVVAAIVAATTRRLDVRSDTVVGELQPVTGTTDACQFDIVEPDDVGGVSPAAERQVRLELVG